MKSLPKMGLHLSLCAIPLCFANLAHAASSTTLSLGGYFTQSAAIIDVDETGNLNLEDESLDQNGEIHFKGKSVLENGTEIGLRVELEASSHGDQIDEHYLYLVADWGKLIIGAENGVALFGPCWTQRFVPGLSSHDNELTDNIYFNTFNSVIGDDTVTYAHISTAPKLISGDANKVSYFTPRIVGLQFGGSFAPNNENANGSESNSGSINKQEDIFEMSLSYKGKTEKNWAYELSLSSVRASNLAGSADPESDTVAANLSYKNWHVGYSQTNSENLNSVNSVKYPTAHEVVARNAVLSYRNDDYSFGVSFFESEEDNSAGGRETDFTNITYGGGIKLANGVGLGYYVSTAEVEKPLLQGAPSMRITLVGATIDLRF